MDCEVYLHHSVVGAVVKLEVIVKDGNARKPGTVYLHPTVFRKRIPEFIGTEKLIMPPFCPLLGNVTCRELVFRSATAFLYGQSVYSGKAGWCGYGSQLGGSRCLDGFQRFSRNTFNHTESVHGLKLEPVLGIRINLDFPAAS